MEETLEIDAFHAETYFFLPDIYIPFLNYGLWPPKLFGMDGSFQP